MSRSIAQVDAYVERAVWLRLARPDIVDLLVADDRAAERNAELLARIRELQNRLNEARDAFAEGRLPLSSLERIEATLDPQIEGLRKRIHEARVAPVLRDLVGLSLEDVQAEWERRTIPQRREIVRVLTERIEILKLGQRKRYSPEESVRIVWRQPKAVQP